MSDKLNDTQWVIADPQGTVAGVVPQAATSVQDAELCNNRSEIDPDVRAFIDMIVESNQPSSIINLASDAAPILDHTEVGIHSARSIEIPGYRIGSEIGRGGQAVVYWAIQKSTGVKVAIKVLVGGALYSMQSMARFDRESRILASLSHHNIVKIIDRGTSATGEQYIIMTFVEGKQFDRWLVRFRNEHGPTLGLESMQALLELFLKICDAVNAAHIRGVMHRDLKPSNILIDERMEPHLLDFGLARTLERTMTDEDDPQCVSITGQFIGSLPWASPEQAQGFTSSLDMRTDVYSLGVMLYQILTAEFPYNVSAPMPAILQSILNDVPMAPSKRVMSKVNAKIITDRKESRVFNAALASLDSIALKALSKSRTDRQQTAGELAREVRIALEKHRVSDSRQNVWVRTRERICDWVQNWFEKRRN